MEQSKIDLFVAQNSSKLPADKMVLVVEKLKTMSDERFIMLQSTSLLILPNWITGSAN